MTTPSCFISDSSSVTRQCAHAGHDRLESAGAGRRIRRVVDVVGRQQFVERVHFSAIPHFFEVAAAEFAVTSSVRTVFRRFRGNGGQRERGGGDGERGAA
ncbi:hypothetical protein [Tahibacter soli]|uniref:Uncharacterized protein n=1 Tax=Tahibacter soli TaxID=2983605 RepID=A0A9X4BH94_9GAMM|nr:hypothetical protein [Tahibacter soli]MDC8012551.1 hypothetical protein [Tahibacter soli]